MSTTVDYFLSFSATCFTKVCLGDNGTLDNSLQLKFNGKTLWFTVFENYIKSRIQHCERSELSLHFELIKNANNGPFGEFLKTGKCRNWKTKVRHFGWFSNTVYDKIFVQNLKNMFRWRNFSREDETLRDKRQIRDISLASI